MSSQLVRDATNPARLALVMVGLPATGKSFTARNLPRYLRWLGVRTRAFSVAHYRRELLAGVRPTADFFDPLNGAALAMRTSVSEKALGELIEWLGGGGQVAILDGSNTISQRRDLIEQRLESAGIQCVFVECLYPKLDAEKHVEELLLTCPEYYGVEALVAIEDFKTRLDHYRKHYSTLSQHPPAKGGFIQLVNGGEEMVIERVNGFLPSRMIYYLMNLRHSANRSIYLYTIHEQQLPCHSPTLADIQDLQDIQRAIAQLKNKTSITVWTHAISAISHDSIRQNPRLKGIEPGTPITPTIGHCPSNHSIPDAYFHRNPQGESFHDLTIRLEPVIMDLEAAVDDVLIVTDRSVISCIYGYYCELGRQEVVGWRVDDDVVIELKPRAYGCYEQRYARSEGGLLKRGEETLRLYNDNISSPSPC